MHKAKSWERGINASTSGYRGGGYTAAGSDIMGETLVITNNHEIPFIALSSACCYSSEGRYCEQHVHHKTEMRLVSVRVLVIPIPFSNELPSQRSAILCDIST